MSVSGRASALHSNGSDSDDEDRVNRIRLRSDERRARRYFGEDAQRPVGSFPRNNYRNEIVCTSRYPCLVRMDRSSLNIQETRPTTRTYTLNSSLHQCANHERFGAESSPVLTNVSLRQNSATPSLDPTAIEYDASNRIHYSATSMSSLSSGSHSNSWRISDDEEQKDKDSSSFTSKYCIIQ